MSYIEQTGGLDNAMPTEGLTFLWNGKVYKLTGTFAPINQILGKDPGRFAEMVASPINDRNSYSRASLNGLIGPSE